MIKKIWYLILVIFIAGCGPDTENAGEADQDTAYVINEKAEVKITVIRYADFGKEILSNGKLKALQKADLYFRTTENVYKIFFRNGDKVTKGQVIASIDNFTLRNTLNQCIEQFEKAKLDLADLLIGQGYSVIDSGQIPSNILLAARIKSGYDRAKNQLELAEYNFNHSHIRAPFSGVLADLKMNEFNRAGTGEKFCTLIDNTRFEAEFNVLENEIYSLQKGQSVRIIPFSTEHLEVNGTISQINPVIDQNGMVTVKALCVNTKNKLIEGLNVKVLIQEKVPKQLIIPKSALVLRSGKQVVFTFENGLAKWNYVKTGLENSSSFTISEGLKEGDSVIVEGNLNLAHDSKVELIFE